MNTAVVWISMVFNTIFSAATFVNMLVSVSVTPTGMAAVISIWFVLSILGLITEGVRYCNNYN